MKLYDQLIQFVEQKLGPIAGKLGAQRHITALRDGFLVAMPFIIVGSFILIFANPPFAADTTNAFGRAWLDFVAAHRPTIVMPWTMSMGIMSLFITMGVAYSLAKSYQMDAIGAAALSAMSFLLVAAPEKGWALPLNHFAGTGIFTALLVAYFSVELTRILKKYNVTIRMPEQVPPAIAASFALLVPVLAIFVTLYPLSLFVQSGFDMQIPDAVMTIFKPLVSASNSLPAIIGALLLCQLLWFAGIHGANIVVGILSPIFLANISANAAAYAAGETVPNLFTQPFWDFYIFIGGAGATLSLVILMSFSKTAHLRSVGRMSFLPGAFQINEPVMFGAPVVMNPTLFIPFVMAPVVNAIIAYVAVNTGIVDKAIAVTPWTAPALIGAAWGAGWAFKASILTAVLMVIDIMIYYPFFKAYEKQVMAQEQATATGATKTDSVGNPAIA
ncbi:MULTISPECIES: PTS sugar transporter subunit IIC [Gammaproteobacteria]|uniref:PTS sugar transporter subunit IIC n=1 Tax=Gammaproteobacteria TaxID=1236 RepID=UPI001ADD53CD|nr:MULTISPECIES: PTS sugar transporter subunit IIC [Gammaproteobacteria]MBO9482533.1 PTS sugar transporter subunit IIC [Salinisphaera sp. G21_0]MBO9493062.1 PTS sugar transporter subunit IIC [Thalassotalea sp. G20_0]